MNIQLINKPISNNPIETICHNRGIKDSEIAHYMQLNDDVINSPFTFGEERLKAGVAMLLKAIKDNKSTVVVVDCDCDGYTSAALLINFLHKLFPSWVENYLHWSLHSGKSHGLSDQMNVVTNYDLIICPDSSSNDYEYHKQLQEENKSILVLDHHLADKISPYAVVINNQLSDYPNKELSGVGVVWQFCRYIDMLNQTNYADNFLDLVALGNCGDMMSLLSFETRRLITKGFQEVNINNPFIRCMIEKNEFPLSKPDYKSANSEQSCTSMGAAFFIVPFVNAVTRSGTDKEKELIFESMLDFKGYTKVPEIKRNKLTGKEEYLVVQAVRVIGNVKNRQSRAEEKGMELLENKIHNDNLLDHQVLLFLVEPDEIEPEIRGLIANKFMAKYQRPCAVLTHTTKPCQAVDRDGQTPISYLQETYEGSMRGYTKTGITSFKDVLKRCPGVMYVEGHDNAAGLGIYASQIDEFIEASDKIISEEADTTNGPIHRVDYFFDEVNDTTKDIILGIGRLNDLWGQDMDRAYVGIRFQITCDNFSLMKSNTLKISLPGGLSLIKFGGTEEDIENFSVQNQAEIKEVEAYCKCNINEWNGTEYPQLIIEDYNIVDYSKKWQANMF